MQNRLGLAHFAVFTTGGLLCLAACVLALFSLFTFQRDTLAREYADAAYSYFEEAQKDSITGDSQRYLLTLARISMEKSVKLSTQQDAYHWMILHDITAASGQYNLADKAMQVALHLDPSLQVKRFALVHPDARKWKPLVLTQVMESEGAAQ